MSSHTAYDFVIAGGGTAGLVLAKRLSEGGKFTVCVLEAGDTLQPGRTDVAMPVMASAVIAKGDIVWPYMTTPQEQLSGQKVELPAGRVVGGSSNVNYAIWTRGNATDYDRVAEITGDPSWTFSAMLPYFKKSETYHYPDSPHTIDPELHGDCGPVHVVPFNASHRHYKWRESAIAGYEAAGFKYGEDINDGQTLGYGELTSSSYFSGGGRQSSRTYIAQMPPTLEIFGGKPVANLILKGTQAVGVITTSGDTFLASKEVLVCAGALRSPAILQLSGIGPKDLLTSLNIPVVVDSPGVGENFWDHPIIHMRWQVREDARGDTVDDLRNPARIKEEMALYTANGTGLLGGAPFEFTAWKNHADICADLISVDQTLSDGYKKYLASREAAHTQYLIAYGYANGRNITGPDAHISISPMLVTPTSRGSVKITSAEPSVLPSFDPKWLANETDRALMKAALKTSSQVMETPAWKQYLTREIGDKEDLIGFSDEMLERKMNECTITTYHYGGTCAMASADSKEVKPVVDPQCRVYGTTCLRVIDLSVYPVPISANTQAPTYALAEKMAASILAEYGA